MCNFFPFQKSPSSWCSSSRQCCNFPSSLLYFLIFFVTSCPLSVFCWGCWECTSILSGMGSNTFILTFIWPHLGIFGLKHSSLVCVFVFQSAEPPELQQEPGNVGAGTTEAAAEKEPPAANIPTAIKYQDDNSLAHPNVSVYPIFYFFLARIDASFSFRAFAVLLLTKSLLWAEQSLREFTRSCGVIN